VGAGISGLCAALKLKEDGYYVKVLDKRPRAGGVIGTSHEGLFAAESGSNSILVNSQKTLDFLRHIGLDDRIVHASETAKKRFFVRYGAPQEVPMGLKELFKTRLFSTLGKLRLMLEPLISPFAPSAEPSVDEFARMRLGKEAAEYAINPFFAGIYAGDTKRLSIKYAFPPFWNFDQKYGSVILGAIRAKREKAAAGNFFKPVMISFKNGMAELTERLEELLEGCVTTNARITNIDFEGKWKAAWSSPAEEDCDEFDRLVLACPAWSLKRLPLCNTLAEALKPLDGIEGAPISTLTLGFKREDVAHPLDGFGALVPEKEKCSILGALFVSSIFENRADKNCVTITCYVGGMRSPELAALAQEEITPLVLKDLARLLGVSGKPVYSHMTKWKRGIPQYNLGYGQFIEAFKNIEETFPSVALVGSYRGGVGVSNCIENALAAAEKLSDE